MGEPTNLVRVVAAFVGGVVIALGGSLIYVRVHDAPRGTVSAVPSAQVAQLQKPISASDQPSSPIEDRPVQPTREEVGPEVTSKPRPAAEHRHSERIKPIVIARARPVDETRRNPAGAQPVVTTSTGASAAALPNPALSSSSQPQGIDPVTPPAVRPDPPPVAVYQPHVVTLQPGTNLNIRLGETISTDSNYPGDTFRAVLDMPIIADGFVIADKGSKVLGRVITAQKAGKVQGTANLGLTLTEINTTDGQQVRVETNAVENRGVSSTRQDAAEIAGGAALGAIIGALAGGGKGAAIGAGAGGAAGSGAVLLTRGKPAKLASETRLSFQLTAPVTITEKLNN